MHNIEKFNRSSKSQENEILRLSSERDEARAVYQAQNQMLAALAHDMRSPMGVILAASQIAGIPDLKEERRLRSLALVQDAARQLQALISDVFDLSRLQLGELDLSSLRFQLRDMLENAIAGEALVALKKGVEIRLWIGQHCPAQVQGDPGRLRQVIQNLITNAVKFTPAGIVEMTVESGETSDIGVELKFSIKDSGMGMEQEALQRIFQPFQQAHRGVAQALGGAGLGLAICQRIVEKMGGQIWVESQIGKGTTFHFTVQLQTVHTCSTAQECDLTGLRVLVADENLSSRAQLEESILKQKMIPVIAESGREGVISLEQAARHNSPFPFAIFDLNIGRGEGFSLLEQVPPDIFESTALLVTTAVGQRGDAVRCQELAVRAYLTHPISREELFHVTRLCLQSYNRGDLITRHILRELSGSSH